MKILIRESQLKRLLERGPNSPAYRGPKGYDDSCDCYIDEELKEDDNVESIKKNFEEVLDRLLKQKYPMVKSITIKPGDSKGEHYYLHFKSDKEITTDLKVEIYRFARNLFKMLNGGPALLSWDFETPKIKTMNPKVGFEFKDLLGIFDRFF